MSDTAASSFVRQELVAERTAPVKVTGFVGFLRARLFNSPTNILLTLASVLLLWITVVPAVKFLLVDAVWSGKDRTACLSENVGHSVGACWPFIQAKFSQFVYGFYPEPERWRVNLTFFLAAILLLPLLIPRLPAKGLNAGLFFVAFPIVAFFLLHGGGLDGLGVNWMTALLSGFADTISDLGQKLTRAGEATAVIGPLVQWLGKLVVLLGAGVSSLIWPMVWLNGQIQGVSRPVWADFAVTAVIVSLILFFLGGGFRTGWRILLGSIATFAGIGIVIAVMGLDRGGLPIVDTGLWGGLLVTLVVSVTGIVTSMPIGIALALGRRSTIPLIRLLLGRLHRILARRSADHRTVLRNLYAAVVPAGQFQDRRPGSRPDRHRAVCRAPILPRLSVAAYRRSRAGKARRRAPSACPGGKPPR